MHQVIDAAYLAKKKEEAIAAIQNSDYFVLAVSSEDRFKIYAVADQYILALASIQIGNLALTSSNMLAATAELEGKQKYDG